MTTNVTQITPCENNVKTASEKCSPKNRTSGSSDFATASSRIASDSQTWTSPSIRTGTLPVPDRTPSRVLKSTASSEITVSAKAMPATLSPNQGRSDHDE